MKASGRTIAQPVLALLFGLVLGLAVTWAAGENPWHVLKILVRGAFGSREDFGQTLFYTTPLIFTGLAVAIPFRAGLFNIGAEGQLTLGALAMAATGSLWPRCPALLAPAFAALAGGLAGGFWGWIPGFLKARRGSHEVINTIMLNFVAAGIASYVTLAFLKSPDTQNPETRLLPAQFMIAAVPFFGEAHVSLALPIALLAAFASWVMLFKTPLGFEFRAVGQSERAAATAGIPTKRIQIVAMSIAGALAGLVGLGEVLGNAGRFRVGFSPDFGFLGIAVALLGRNHPFGIVLSALFLAALHKGAADLDLETEHVTRELSLVMQALVILSVSSEALWSRTRRLKHDA